MKRHPCVFAVSVAVGSCSVLTAHASAVQIFETSFTKNNNIFTNLNQQFPHTDNGSGVPGSSVGTPNATALFDPANYTSANYTAGSNAATNGIRFLLASDAAGHDFEQVDNGTSLVVPINQSGVTSVSALTGAYNGVAISVTLTGRDGATQTFTGVSLPDFNGGASINQSSAVNSATTNYFDQTVLRVQNVGAGGTGNSTNGAFNSYDLVEQTFVLNSTLAAEPLTSITFVSTSYEPLVLGVTVSAVPEPATLSLLGLAAAAGLTRRGRH